jgi:hypothetical protein
MDSSARLHHDCSERRRRRKPGLLPDTPESGAGRCWHEVEGADAGPAGSTARATTAISNKKAHRYRSLGAFLAIGSFSSSKLSFSEKFSSREFLFLKYHNLYTQLWCITSTYKFC